MPPDPLRKNQLFSEEEEEEEERRTPVFLHYRMERALRANMLVRADE